MLVVMDGVGVSASPNSTLRYAQMPAFREMEKFFPFTTLQASGVAVGLPWGEEGNSEVGHLTMGAGRVLYHHLPRIITSVKDGSFFKNKVFSEAANFVKEKSSALHFLGLYSSGSVHAYADHLYALLEFAARENLSRVYLHLFSDGKDAPTNEGKEYFKVLEEKLARDYPFAKIATVSGRHYAMDRDAHWDRIEKFYKCATAGECREFVSATGYLENCYAEGVLDEHIEPAISKGKDGMIKLGDAVIFYNFREDSMRQIVSLFTKFEGLYLATMTEYDKRLAARVAFPSLDVDWPLARVIAEAGLKQLHIAETEKYAHVTYFFNGGNENPYTGEERVLVPSPKAASYADAPEMSSEQIVELVIQGLEKYDFILANFANGDMVGHTGNFEATVKALEAVDAAVGKLKEKISQLSLQ